MTPSQKQAKIDRQHDKIETGIGRIFKAIALASFCLGIGSCGASVWESANNPYTGAPQVRRYQSLTTAVNNIDMTQDALSGRTSADIPKDPEIRQRLDSEGKKLSETRAGFQAELEKARQDPIYERFSAIESRREIYNFAGLILTLGIPFSCAVGIPCFSLMNGEIRHRRLSRYDNQLDPF